ncbi:MAG: hypothetical protein RJAPGHWK_002137 [Candidatus Fervidibacter sp.]
MDLQGKVALVTGAAKRLGRAIALALGERGAQIAVHFRSSEREVMETVATLQTMGANALPFCADLTDETQVRKLMEDIARSFGRLDILVASAAIFERTPFDQLTAERWRTMLETNLTGVFLCCRYAADLLRAGDGGVIVTISDTAAFRPWAEFLPYCVAKAGVIALTQGLAKALAPKVRVNCVALGTVLPPEPMDEKAWRAEMSAKTLLGRLGTPEEVVQAVLFCITCDYLTGAVIPLDGGRFLR